MFLYNDFLSKSGPIGMRETNILHMFSSFVVSQENLDLKTLAICLSSFSANYIPPPLPDIVKCRCFPTRFN